MDAAELDIENRAALQRYLQSNFSPAEEFEILDFRALPGGVSSRTVRVRLSGGQEWVLKQALPKLRVEADWFSDPRRVHREALGMKVLGELVPGSVPKLVFDDERHHVIGMEAVPEPHENWKTMLLAGRDDAFFYALKFGELLGRIHGTSAQHREKYSVLFDDRTFFESLRIEPYYTYSAEKEPRVAEFYRQLIDDTRSTRLSLVHGDYSPKNVLVHRKRIVLLDHEVIHWGDPGFDVGFALTHLLGKANHLPAARQEFRNAARSFWGSYESEVQVLDPPNPLFNIVSQLRCVRHTLGCLMARVVGRSPLEYLAADEKLRQWEIVLRLMTDIPATVLELIDRFVKELER